MKYNVRLIGLLLLCVTVFSNCLKETEDPSGPSIAPPDPTLISIENYIIENNLSPEYTDSGLGYIVTNEGSAERATPTGSIKAIVTVKTTDDIIKLDSQGELVFNLAVQPAGMIEGMQFIGPGGSIKLYVPTNLAYGITGNSAIPGSADVIIELTLVDVLVDVETYIENNSVAITDTTASGVYVLIEEEGDGTFPTADNNVNVKYSGYFTNGDVFDSNANAKFALTEVIQGWTEGIPKFSKGGKGKLFIPYEVAYGLEGRFQIPGRTDLIFDIELIDIE